MTRAQQTQVLGRLRELEAALAEVVFTRNTAGRYVDESRCPPSIIGRCRVVVGQALREAGETPRYRPHAGIVSRGKGLA